MAKLFLIQRKNSRGVKFLKTDPSKGKFLWTEDPSEAYKFDELDVAEEWMDDDNVGGTEVVRRAAAIAEYGDDPSDDTEVEVKVKPKKTKTPSLEELAPLARGKSAKRQAVKVKDEDSEEPTTKKSAAKKAAPAPIKKTVTPAKKAAAKTTPPAKAAKASAQVGETKLTAMRLPLTLVDQFAKLGSGNVSAGVRKMAEEYFSRKK